MVSRHRAIVPALILLVLCFQTALLIIPMAQAAVTYSVSREWTKIWVNTDGSIDLMYNITMTYTSGSPEGIFRVGMPKGGFQIQYARDISGTSLQSKDVSSGSFYGIDVTLKSPIVLNQPNTFIVYAVVPGMISPDSTNPGNVGMQFYPTTLDTASGPIGNVRVAIVLPQGVNSSDVKYPTGVRFDNVYMESNNLVVYWERSNWPAAQQFTVGVSFPAKYVTLVTGPSIWLYVAIGAIILAVIVLLVVILRRRRKAPYEKPHVAVEALGALHGLTAVEAATVLDVKPVRVLTMVIFGLLMKRKIQLTAAEPIIKVKELAPPQGEAAPTLRYYEIDCLRSIEPDGSFNDMRLARTYLGLKDNVDKRLRGYSRADTVNYYKSVVGKAWDQVTQAGTPELRGDTVEQNIDWLLTDENFAGRFKTFPSDMVILPRLGWYWYWPYMPSTARAGLPPTAGDVKPVPIQEFANNVVKGLEQTSNNMVKDIQAFTNRLVAPQQAEARSVRGASHCVCACHACACACACVGCACACAGGGGR
jgi:hypothetical protein